MLTEFLEYTGCHERPEKIRTNLAQLQKRGLKPILAHPERYRALQDDRDLVRELADSGVLMQVNAFDLERNLNPVTRELAQWMAREKLISFIGSDMHGMRPGARRPVMPDVSFVFHGFRSSSVFADVPDFVPKPVVEN